MDEVLNLLESAKVFFIATVDGTKPRVRPFGFVMQYQEKLFFCTGNHKPFAKQLRENPWLEISAINDKNEWIRLSGKGIFVDDIDAKKRAFEVNPGVAALYQDPANPDFAVFYMEAPHAEICSFVATPRTVM